MIPRQVVEEARLEDTGAGVAPKDAGWFIVNVRDTAWMKNDAFGAKCVFEGDVPGLRDGYKFPEVGFSLRVIQPGRSSGLYHAESGQEDFVVLMGECLLLVEGQERPLKAWDFVHLPAGTGHVFVGSGDGPCAIYMTGARTPDRKIVYPRSEVALRHGAGVETEAGSPAEAYAEFPHWQLGRPSFWAELPWA